MKISLMHSPATKLMSLASLAVLILTTFNVSAAVPEIVFEAMPEGEVQSKLLNDKQGRIHQIYFKIRPETFEGDLFYRQLQADARHWSAPIQVSDKVIPLPNIAATASFAVDDSGRVHVVWLQGPEVGYAYSYSNIQATEFQPERLLDIKHREFLEPGASIAVLGSKVTISWASGEDEDTRAIYTLTSVNNGESFGDERLVGQRKLGACICCSHSSIFASDGRQLIAYRSAVNGSGRHIQLLTLPANGKKSQTQLIARWIYDACPVSTNSMVQDPEGQSWLVFENDAKVYQLNLQEDELNPQLIRQSGSDVRQKHPSVAFNKAGYKLVVWSEGFDFFGGGEVKFQLYDPKGAPVKSSDLEAMHAARYSFTAVSTLPDGSFVVFY